MRTPVRGLALLVVALAAVAGGCKEDGATHRNSLVALLRIETVAPTQALAAGGTTLTLTGAAFKSGATVTVGGNLATGLLILSSTRLTAVAPAGTAGPADVTVTALGGASVTAIAAVTYVSGAAPAPTLTGVAPTFGPLGGGTTITLTGTGFQTGATVRVGGVLATNVVVKTGGVLTCRIPAGGAGPATVIVTNPDAQAATVPGAFTYGAPPPAMTGLAPLSGPVGGGTALTLTGTGFRATDTTQPVVRIGSVACSGVQALTAATIVCTTGASPVVGPQTVTVVNPDGQQGLFASGYSYLAPNPVVSGVIPLSGPAGGGTLVTIAGSGFFPGATVRIGLNPATVTSVGSTVIVATTPAGPIGPATVCVTNLDRAWGTAIGAYTFMGPAPTLPTVSPTSGTNAGGAAVTLTGTNFVAGATVTFGTATAAVTGLTATQIVVTTPAVAPSMGLVNVTVTNVDGQTATRANGYNFQGAAPTVAAIWPAAGPAAGGIPVTVTGSGFAASVAVSIGGSAATVTASTPTMVVATTPSGTVGPATVLVSNPDGQNVTVLGGYTFQGPQPTLTAVNPAAAANVGGTTITLTGTGFATGATVTVDGVAATSVAVVLSTSITCVTPNVQPTVGPVTVVVTNLDGRFATLAGGFTAQGGSPTVTSVAPLSGSTGGGTLITITGTNFAAGATVTVGGTSATSVTIVSPTSVECYTPAGASGAVTVTVTNPDTQAGSLGSAYTYVGGPGVTSVSPTNGTASGGTVITVTGTNFAGAATVSVGGVAATSITVVSTTSITAITPSGTVGPADVTVTNPGPVAATLPGAFTYTGALPTLTGVAPSNGPIAGGTTLTLTGANYVAGATVTVGGVAASVGSLVATQIVCTTGAGPIGPANVVVTNPDGNAVTSPAFTYLGATPSLSGVSPAVGPLAGGTVVTLTGSGFALGATVSIGGVPCPGIVRTSSLFVGTTGAGVMGPQTVTLTNVDGQLASLAAAFTYQGPAPTLTAVSPGAGPNGGGTTLSLTGTGFAPGVTVTVGGVASGTVVLVSATSIAAIAPSVAPTLGPVAVTVTNVDGQAATLAAAWNATGQAPSLSAVAPTSGPNTGGTVLTLTGSGFAAGAVVVIGDTPAATVTVVSATVVHAVVPSLAPVIGPRAVTIRNPDGQQATLAAAWNALGATPTLASVAPASGAQAGGTSLTLTGTGFAAGATVTVGGAAATAVSVVSATSLTCTTPSLTPTIGPVAVTVTNLDGQGATLGSAFTAVGAAPLVTAANPASGPAAGGSTVTLTGAGFAAGATVTIGGAAATVGAIAPGVLVVTTPAGAVGPTTIVVTNIDAQAGSLVAGFTFLGATPTLASIAPTSGTNGGGSLVTLTGTGFAAGATVSFGGTAATGVTLVSATTVTCLAPALAPALGPTAVTLTNPDGQPATLGAAWNALGAAPTLASIAPTGGTTGGGTLVTLTGTGFAAGATVAFGGTAAAVVTVVSATTITTWSPAGSAGSVGVTVTNLDLQQVALGSAFTYVVGPALTAVAPTAGTRLGGTTITLTGTGFVSGATVAVGGTAATSVVFVSSTQLTASTPAGAVGPAAVTVTNPGPAAATLPAGFTFTGPSPTIGSVTPAAGPTTGGTTVTIAGTNFFAGATVTLGGSAATVGSLAGTQIVVTTGPGPIGPGAAVVTNLDGNSVSSAGAYTYQAPFPNVTGIAPASGPLAGGTTVTLTGTNFAAGATVTIGGAAATVGSLSATAIVATTGAGAVGPQSLIVTNVDGRSGTLVAGYTYVGPLPTVTAVAPTGGANSGGTAVTLTGTGFAAGATVRFGAVAAGSVVVVSATSCTCVAPAVAPAIGPVDVRLTNLDGQAGTLVGGWNALGATPSLTLVSPAAGPHTGGTGITLTGSGFVAGTTVTIGGAAATVTSVPTSSSLLCIAPGLAPALGPQAVVVTNPDAQSATLPTGWNAQAPAPALASVAPASGTNAGGVVVTCTGSSFFPGMTVTVGGVAATSVTIVSGTSLTAITPNLAPVVGPVTVAVTNVDGLSATLLGGWLAIGPTPTIGSVAPLSGSNAGGTALTLTGTGFAAGATVTVGGIAATSVAVVSATSVTAVAPSLAPALGPSDVTCTNLDGLSATLVGGWNALGGTPTLTAVAPTGGTTGGGTLVTCTGTNFAAGATVTFGGAAATGVTVVSGTSCTAFTPAGSGTVAVVVTNVDLQSVTLTGAFTFSNGPSLTAVAPASGPQAGGTVITLTGTNFVTGITVSVGGAAATSVTLVSPTQVTAITPSGTAGPVTVTATVPGPLATSLPAGFTYQFGVNDQTAAYVFDTATGIDCRRRWYVNLNHPALLKDMQNRGLQSWGTPGDSTAPPGSPPLVDQYALDWLRAYVLRTVSIAYGRNADGTGISGTSVNITFVGLAPASGARGCATPSTDWGEMCVGGCDPNGNGGPHPSASAAGCTSGTVGTAFFDQTPGTGACNGSGEVDCNTPYHGCASCSAATGVFVANLGNLWNQSLPGGRLVVGDQPFLDGTTTTGARYTQIHDFLKQYARRIAFVAAHEIGHSVGLVASGTGSPCTVSSGLCGAAAGHNGCCSTNVMGTALNLGGTFTDFTLGFSGNPAGPSAAAACSTGGTSSWALLQAFCGLTP